MHLFKHKKSCFLSQTILRIIKKHLITVDSNCFSVEKYFLSRISFFVLVIISVLVFLDRNRVWSCIEKKIIKKSWNWTCIPFCIWSVFFLKNREIKGNNSISWNLALWQDECFFSVHMQTLMKLKSNLFQYQHRPVFSICFPPMQY